MIREKFETHKRAFYLLSEGQEAIQNVLPAGSNSGINFANSTAADKLKHLMEEVSINYSMFLRIFQLRKKYRWKCLKTKEMLLKRS